MSYSHSTNGRTGVARSAPPPVTSPSHAPLPTCSHAHCPPLPGRSVGLSDRTLGRRAPGRPRWVFRALSKPPCGGSSRASCELAAGRRSLLDISLGFLARASALRRASSMYQHYMSAAAAVANEALKLMPQKMVHHNDWFVSVATPVVPALATSPSHRGRPNNWWSTCPCGSARGLYVTTCALSTVCSAM